MEQFFVFSWVVQIIWIVIVGNGEKLGLFQELKCYVRVLSVVIKVMCLDDIKVLSL